MSAYAYGSMVQPQSNRLSRAEDPANKFVAAVAALIPADVLALHALVLTWTTKTDDHGTTTITNEPLLGASLFVLLVLAIALFTIGRGFAPRWQFKDWILMAIPPLAFLAWTALLGTSALSPLIPDGWPRAALWFAGTVLAVILIALNARLTRSPTS
jgi:hypothetical protein